MRPHNLLLPIIVLTGVLFIACGGGNDASNGAGGESESARGPAAEGSAATQAEEDLSIEERAVAAAAAARAAGIETQGRDHEFAMTESELVTAIEAVETLVASCMEAAGFQYLPVDVITTRQAMDTFGVVPGLSDEDFAAQFGFGISTLFEEAGIALVLGENERILADLSDAD